MGRTSRNKGLRLGYRFRWRVRYILVNVFGPARLGDDNDPAAALRRERQDKVEQARREHP